MDTFAVMSSSGRFQTDVDDKRNIDSTKKRLGTKLVVAAIDIGTTYSGYAYSFKFEYDKNPLKIYTNSAFCAEDLITLKGPTVVLFDRDGNFDSFGFEAENRYAELAEDDAHRGWKYFKRFKMNLFDKRTLKRNMMLKDDQGTNMEAVNVFAAAIKYHKERLMKELKSRIDGITELDISWVLTVPAIWNDGAKQFMKDAAAKAGIPEHQLSLALEPESAAIYCKTVTIIKAIKDGRRDELRSFDPGAQFMVIDLGGGTVGITVHEVMRDGTLCELCQANGGPWGGTLVDDAFKRFLSEIFTDDVLKDFSKEEKVDELNLFRTFELKKRTIWDTESEFANKSISMKIPNALIDSFREVRQEDFANWITRTTFATIVEKKRDKLFIDKDVIKDMFIECKTKLVEHLSFLIQKPELRRVDTILMVGGFSESDIMTSEVKRKFPDRKVIVPPEAGLAVVKGAVMYGHNPGYISSGKMGFTNEIQKRIAEEPSRKEAEERSREEEKQKRIDAERRREEEAERRREEAEERSRKEEAERRKEEEIQIEKRQKAGYHHISGNFGFYPMKVLGHGSHAIVYEGEFGQFDVRPIAVKVVKCSNKQQAKDTQTEIVKIFQNMRKTKEVREIKTMEALNRSSDCTNIIQLIDSYIDIEEANVYLAFELAKGTLHDYVEPSNVSWQDLLTVENVVRGIVDGVKYTHELKLVHRDLKPANIFIVAQNKGRLKAVIGDFGSAKATTTSMVTLTSKTGSLGYIAPEIWKIWEDDIDSLCSRFDRRSDIFSLALVMYFTLSLGKHPFGNPVIAQGKFSEQQPKFQHLYCYPNSIAQEMILRRMLDIKPEERPRIEEISDHPALWSTTRTMQFFVNKSDEFETMIKTDPLKGNILEDPKLIKGGNWINQLPINMKKYLENYKVNRRSPELYSGKETSIRHLLRAIRNTERHHHDYPASARAELGTFPDRHIALWLKVCPGLLVHVFEKLGP